MATTDDSTDDFGVSMTAKWFHVIPHIDIEFKYVNSTFDPSSNAYLEALGIIIAVPAFWLILTLLAFLIFFICRCCDTAFKKKKKLTALKWVLCIFAILSCGALSVGLYGNVQAHKGVEKVQTSAADVQNILYSIKNKTTSIKESLHGSVTTVLDQLEKAFQKTPDNQTVRQFLERAVVDMRDQVALSVKSGDEIGDRADLPTISTMPQTIHFVELIRWPATFALSCLLILICLILILGVARHSRCLLILFSVLGLLSVVICWVLVSFYIGICVASADFCLNPDPFIESQATGTADKAVINFYLKCGTSADPFEDSKMEFDTAIQNLASIVTNVKAVADEIVPEVQDFLQGLLTTVQEDEKVVTQVEALLNCQDIHKDYKEAMTGICTDGLEGMGFMLLSAVGSGLLFTVLIWMSSHTWIHIRKKNAADQVDEEDPFLPATAVGSNPRRNRETNGRPNSREEQTFLQGRYTPPPAYEQLSGGAGRYQPYKT